VIDSGAEVGEVIGRGAVTAIGSETWTQIGPVVRAATGTAVGTSSLNKTESVKRVIVKKALQGPIKKVAP